MNTPQTSFKIHGIYIYCLKFWMCHTYERDTLLIAYGINVNGGKVKIKMNISFVEFYIWVSWRFHSYGVYIVSVMPRRFLAKIKIHISER